jgi:hypothetical protein
MGHPDRQEKRRQVAVQTKSDGSTMTTIMELQTVAFRQSHGFHQWLCQICSKRQLPAG